MKISFIKFIIFCMHFFLLLEQDMAGHVLTSDGPIIDNFGHREIFMNADNHKAEKRFYMAT